MIFLIFFLILLIFIITGTTMMSKSLYENITEKHLMVLTSLWKSSRKIFLRELLAQVFSLLTDTHRSKIL